MILTYEAIDKGGTSTRNTVEAPSTHQAVERLRDRGLYVTRIDEVVNPKSRSSALSAASLRLPLKTLVLFTRQMAMLLRAGSAVVPAMMAIKRQVQKPEHAALFGQIVSDLEDGVPLAEALRQHHRTFDPVYCAVVAAGEASGTLTGMFERISSIVGKRRAMRNKVIGALVYPALLTVMSGSIMLVLLFFVLPRFDDMFTQLHVEAPALTRLMLSVAGTLVAYWPAVLGAVLLFGFAVVFLLTSKHGRQWGSNVQTQIPVLGRIRSKLILAQVFRTMGILLQSGVGVLDAVGLVSRSTSNRRFGALFLDLKSAVSAGGNLSSAFEDSGLVEPAICQVIITGEESGNLGGAISYCADVLDETNTELINALMRLVEPVILIAMGLVVGTVAVSLFLPLFDMTSALQ